jgi:deoxyribonuclease V
VLPSRAHCFDLNPDDAVALQSQLASQVITEDKLPPEIRLVAGVDVAYDDARDCLFAAVVILDTADLRVIETVTAEGSPAFAYIPGLFSFRELPAIAPAVEKLRNVPDLVICDGHGIAHPRRFGLACHLGVTYDVPAIGCGKTRLIGEADEPGSRRGEMAKLTDGGEVIGAVLRTQDAVKPVYVSPGHRISLPTACNWVLRLASKYRLPEPIRAANHTVNELRAAHRIR